MPNPKHPVLTDVGFIAEQVEEISELVEQGCDETYETSVLTHVIRASELLEEYLNELRLCKQKRDKEAREELELDRYRVDR